MGIQTKLLTHNSEGALKAPSEKEFIDFKFDGKYLSEFGWVAVSDSDRHSFDSFPSFKDETTEINGVSGQLFWGTSIGTLSKTFKIATDGVTEADIELMRLHFQPGKYGEFIEDKLLHRKGYARIDKAISFSVVPFKKTITVAGRDLVVNEYKGEATISFIFDDPFMRATENYLPDLNSDENLRAAYINNTPALDNLIVYEDSTGSEASYQIYEVGEPLKQFENLQRTNIVSNLDYYNPSLFTSEASISLEFTPSFHSDDYNNFINPNDTKPLYFYELADEFNSKNLYNSIRCSDHYITLHNDIAILKLPQDVEEKIGSIVNFEVVAIGVTRYQWEFSNDGGFNWLPSSSPGNDTAILSDYEIKDTRKGYKFRCALYSGNSTEAVYTNVVQIIPFTNLIKNKSEVLKFTTPNMIYNLHKAINIAYQFYLTSPTGAAIELLDKLRMEILNYDVLAWAMKVISAILTKTKYYNSQEGTLLVDSSEDEAKLKIQLDKLYIDPTDSGTFNANWFQYFNTFMLAFLRQYKAPSNPPSGLALEEQMDISQGYNTYKITFDGVNHEVIVEYNANVFSGTSISTINNYSFNGSDMLRSSHLKLPGGNKLGFEKNTVSINSYYKLSFFSGNSTAKWKVKSLKYEHIY